MADQLRYKGDGYGSDYNVVPYTLAKSLGKLSSDLLVTGLIRNITPEARAKGSRFGDVVRFPKRGQKTARTMTPGSGWEATATTDTDETININKWKFYDVMVEDSRVLYANPDLLQGYIDDGALSLAEAIETDVIANYASAENTVGSAGGTFVDATLLAIRKKARQLKFRQTEPTYLVYGVLAEEDLLGVDKQVLVSESGSNNALVNARFGKRYGMDFYTSNMMPTITGTPTAEHALCFQNNAMGIAFVDMDLQGSMPEGMALPVDMKSMVWTDDNGRPSYSMRYILSYDHKNFAPLLTLDTIYGTGVVDSRLLIDVMI